MTSARYIEQASAIPYRVVRNRLELCLITSIRTGRWGFPKGIIDPGETPEQTALKEAHEEAGLSGYIVGASLGSYTYRKWNSDLRVQVFLMEISQVDEHFDEATVRQRRFCEAEEATRLLEGARPFALFEQALRALRAPPRTAK